MALISCSEPFSVASCAGAQSANMVGRPGLNPLRYTKFYHLDHAHFAMAETVAKMSGVNAWNEKMVRNGYYMPPKAGTLSMGATKFIEDDRCWVESVPNEQDMRRMELPKDKLSTAGIIDLNILHVK